MATYSHLQHLKVIKHLICRVWHWFGSPLEWALSLLWFPPPEGNANSMEDSKAWLRRAPGVTSLGQLHIHITAYEGCGAPDMCSTFIWDFTWMGLEHLLIPTMWFASGCHQNSRKFSKASPSYILAFTAYDGCDAPLVYLILKWEPTWIGLEHHLIHTKPWFAPQEVIRMLGKIQRLASKSSSNKVRTATYAHLQHMKDAKHLICVWNWCKSIRSPHEWSWASVVWPVPLGGNENSMSMEDS